MIINTLIYVLLWIFSVFIFFLAITYKGLTTK